MRENPFPDIVEPTPEPVPAELEAFDLTVSRVETSRVDVPTVDGPTGEDAGVSTGRITLRRAGLALYYVVLVHAVALLGLAGLVVVGRGRGALGRKLLVAGAILAVYTLYRYRHPPRLPR